MVFGDSIGRQIPSESTSLRQNSNRQSEKDYGCYNQWDGFTVISFSFFMMTLAITFALVLQIYYGSPEVSPHGAVATDDQLCSEVGIALMTEGGNAVDAVLASLVCLSVTQPHLVGPGGGGVILLHDHKKNMSKVFNFMSGVPKSLPYPMLLDSNDHRSIGIPGFLRGLKSVHQKHGVLPWKKLFEPSIKLAREGFAVSMQMEKEALKDKPKNYSQSSENVFFSKWINMKEGDNRTRPKYANFLEDVAEKGPDEFYLLKYGVEVIESLKKSGSQVSVSDLQNYEVKETDVLITKLQQFDLITAGLPFGGLQTVAGLHFLNRSKVNLATTTNALYHEFAKSIDYGAAKLVEAAELDPKLKFSLQDVLKDDANLTDDHWILPNQPAAQVASVDAFDLYVSAIVGLGTRFGSRVVTEHEIIFNNQLYGDFKDTKFSNKEAFKDRPLTTYTPFILADHHNVCGNRMVLSSGSSSASLQVIAQILFRNHHMTHAIQEPRVALGREQNVLKINDLEQNVERLPGEVRNYLKEKNYTFQLYYFPISVNGVSKRKDALVSHSDTRGGGFASRLTAPVDDGEKDAANESFHIVKTSQPSNVAKLVVPPDI